MKQIIILGSGAAPGVPSVALGFGKCNPNNLKNYRTRTSAYVEIDGDKILIDTSPDLRTQMIAAGIRELDGVLYTHSHADHLHGIDDLREINRVMRKPLNIYATSKTMRHIKKRFGYLISSKNDGIVTASLVSNKIKKNKAFYIGNTKIVAVELLGHLVPTVAYVFNDGEIVYISDCKDVDKNLFKAIKKEVGTLILPLTNIYSHAYHMDINKVNEIIEKIKPQKAIINHMSTCCDYDEVNNLTNDNVFPAYDGMKVEI